MGYGVHFNDYHISEHLSQDESCSGHMRLTDLLAHPVVYRPGQDVRCFGQAIQFVNGCETAWRQESRLH